MSVYTTPSGTRFSFSGWQGHETPVACFERGDYLAALHGAMLAMSLMCEPSEIADAIADDGLLHELVHLAAGVDISTHTMKAELRIELNCLINRVLQRLRRMA